MEGPRDCPKLCGAPRTTAITKSSHGRRVAWPRGTDGPSLLRRAASRGTAVEGLAPQAPQAGARIAIDPAPVVYNDSCPGKRVRLPVGFSGADSGSVIGGIFTKSAASFVREGLMRFWSLCSIGRTALPSRSMEFTELCALLLGQLGRGVFVLGLVSGIVALAATAACQHRLNCLQRFFT